MRSSRSRQTTLRDVQRAMARGIDALWLDKALHALGAPGYQNDGQYQEYRPMVDRLVAQYGPHKLVSGLRSQAPLTSGEERKKNTDEVAPATSRTSNERHGGDGASGEVPDGHSTKGDVDSRQVRETPQPKDECSESKEDSGGPEGLEKQAGQGTADHSAESTGQATSERVEETGHQSTPQTPGAQAAHAPSVAQDSAAEQPGSNAGQQTSGGESVADQTENMAVSEAGNDTATTSRSIREDDTTSRSDEPKLKQAGVAEDSTEKTSSSFAHLARAAAKHATVSRQATRAHGGVFDQLARHHIDQRLVRRVQTLLTAWMADGADDEQSQRWDYPELAARLLTRRNPFSARRRELGRPALLVLADVSGSCAGFSNQSLLVAKAIAATGSIGADVVIVAHSNGCPEEISVNNRPQPELISGLEHDYYNASAYSAFYRDLAARYGISHAIVLGDHDAVDVYALLATSTEIQSFVWLDNHGCNNHGPRRDMPTTTLAARAAIRYVTGCKGANEFLRGLQVALH